MFVFSNVASHKQFCSLENIFRPYVTYTKEEGQNAIANVPRKRKEGEIA